METNPIHTPLAPAHGQDRAGALELIPPCGGRLINLLVPTEARRELADFAGRLPSLQLTARALCDLELLATGAFSPLDRFLGRASYERVLGDMRLADGSLWPIPVTLNVSESALPPRGDWVALRDAQNNLIAAMRIEEAFACDVREEARQVLQTVDSRHPLVAEMSAWGKTCISGELRVLALPRCYDFPELRLTPAQVRERLLALGRRDVVAFQTRNPLHRAHEVMTQRAAASVDGSLLLHPVVGLTRDGDVDYSTRVRIYRTVAERYYDASRTLLSLLPLAMRMAGPREALWHALIRRNYGANHLIVGRDHAGPGLDSASHPFYPPYAAQELVRRHEAETGVKEITFHELAYLPDTNEYKALDEVPAGTRALTLSGTQVRHNYLVRGVPLPEWFTRPETAAILQDAYPPRHQQGFCVWFTGLSGSGKSTTAHILTVLLQAHGRQVTVLDGDVVRTHLSKGLGFSREDRDANILRIGFVAAEIVRHHGVAICAAVSPYRAVRDQNRRLIGSEHFIEVFMNTPLAVCETRDAKGLYAKARRGEIKGFTGIDDPYEEPLRPEVRLETVDRTPEENARRLLRHLVEAGFIRPIEASQTAWPPELTGGNGGQL